MLNPCNRFFVHLAEDNTPIAGTMFSTTHSNGQATCKREIAAVPNYQVAITKECRPATKLRYFYRINSQTNAIVPNSLFSMTHKPTSMCSGMNKILEFIVQS